MSNKPLTDADIVALYLARDESAIEHTARLYGHYCLSVAMNILNSQPDAEECVNDTWIKTWNSIPPQKPTVLRLFLGKITRNLAIDRYRQRKIQNKEFELTLEELASARARGGHMYAAYVDGKVAGFVQLEKQGEGVYMFRRFAVLPEYQKLGIGRALVSHCRERAALYGGRILRLIMIDKNTRLKDFYISNGFKTVGSQEAPSLPFDFFIMELELT